MPKLLFDRGPEHQPISWTLRGPDGRTVLKRIATVLALGLLLLPLAIGAAVLSGLDHRWPDILAQFPGPALVATVVFAVTLLLLRLRVAFVGALAVTLVLVIALWPQSMADRGKARAGAPVVTLYSANIHYLNNDAAKIRSSIEAANPDVIVLIETSRGVLGHLDTVLAGYPYRRISIASDRSGGRDAAVVASRYPMTIRRETNEDSIFVLTTLDSPLGRLNIMGAHLTRPWPYQIQWEQIRQAENLATLMTYVEGPTIVAGDFNSVSSGRIGRQIHRETGLTAAPGWPGTWPAQVPPWLAVTIDQVWRTPDLAIISRKVGKATGSDHWPVVTQITLAEPRPAP